MNQKTNFILSKNFFEKFFIIILFFFYSMEFFSYDSEIIIVTCILTFIILFYYNFRISLYNAFYVKTLKLRIEYINFLIVKRNVESKLKSFYTNFFLKENLLIKILSYILIFIKSDYKLQLFSRKIFISYLFKDKLIFFIKQFSLVNRLKFWFILHISFLKVTIMLKMFEFINKFSKVFVKDVFRLFKQYSNVEIYFAKNMNFGSAVLYSFDNLEQKLSEVKIQSQN